MKIILLPAYWSHFSLFIFLISNSSFPITLTGTESSLVLKFDSGLESHKAYVRRKAANQFAVEHFAGQVVYTAYDFLDKNRDALPTEVSICLYYESSNVPIENNKASYFINHLW